MVYVDFMKNCYLAHSKKLMAVRLVSASSAQKTFDWYFLDMVYVEFRKNFYFAHSKDVIAVRLISAYSTQKVWFLISGDDVRRVHEKLLFHRLEPANRC